MDTCQEAQLDRIRTLVAFVEAQSLEGEPADAIRPEEARSALENAIVACSSQLYVFGARIGSEALRRQFRVPPSELMHLPDTELRRTGQITVEAVKAYEDKLGVFGYTRQLGEALVAAQEQFQRLMGVPREAASDRVSAGVETWNVSEPVKLAG